MTEPLPTYVTQLRSAWQPTPTNAHNPIKLKATTLHTTDHTVRKKKQSYSERQADTTPNALFRVTAMGIGVHGETVALHVTGYQPYFFIEMPSGARVTDRGVTELLQFFQSLLKSYLRNEIVFGACKIEHHCVYKGYQFGRKRAFLRLVFHSDRCRKALARLVERGVELPETVFGDSLPIPPHKLVHFALYENNCEALVRFLHDRELDPCGWWLLRAHAYEVCSNTVRETRAHIELECTYAQVHPTTDKADKENLGKIMLASFDIEADSSHGDFPVAIKDYTKPVNELTELLLSEHERLQQYKPKRDLSDCTIATWLKYAMGVLPAERVNAHTRDALSQAFVDTSDTSCTLKGIKWTAIAHDINELLQTAMSADTYIGDKVVVHVPKKATTDKDEVVEIRGTGNAREYKLKKARTWVKPVPLDGAIDKQRKSFQRENGNRAYCDMNSHEQRRRKKTFKQVLHACLTERLPKLEGDKVIQIGTVFWRFGESAPCLRHLIALDTCDPIDGVVVESCATERDVLLKWAALMRAMAPNVVTGYNIFGFDYKFMWERADALDIVGEFGDLSLLCDYQTTTPHPLHKHSRAYNQLLPGREKGDPQQCRCDQPLLHCKMVTKKLSSAGLGDNILYFMDVPGMVQIDMLKDIMKDHNLGSYKLDDVASTFIQGGVQSFTDVQHDTSEHEEKQDDTTHTCTQFTSDNRYGVQVNDYVQLYKKNAIGRDPIGKYRLAALDDNADGAHVFTLASHVELQPDAKYEWGLGKDDVSPQDIFRMQKEGSRERAVIGKYCVQDCQLVLTLMMKLQTIPNNLGMSSVCSVPFQYIFTRGQGIKTFSLLSRETAKRGFRIPYRRADGVDVSAMSRDEQVTIHEQGFPAQTIADVKETYQGAFVLKPKPGIYTEHPVAVLDYSSLYPSSIISHNLSPDTIVLDPAYLGDEGAAKLHALGLTFKDVTYDNYISVRVQGGTTYTKQRNTHNPTTTCRYIQPARNDDNSIDDDARGVLPQTVRILLTQRKATRAKIKTEPDAFKRQVLDGLQLAYKVTANSVYGSLGATTNPIFFKDIAASTTAIGREMLLFAKAFVTKHYAGADIVYGDTDSIFINFNVTDEHGAPILGDEALAKTIAMGIDAGERATHELQKVMLLAPQDLEYEKTFYPFVLFSKKRYASIKYEHNPNKGKLDYMGIVLKRRDNAPIVKHVYSDVLGAILHDKSIAIARQRLQQNLRKLLDGGFPLRDFVITKALRGHYENPDQIVHKVLADRMAERDPGNKPQANDRIPYAYIDMGTTPVKLQGDRVEHPDFIRAHNKRIDYTFYITNQISKPIAQIFALKLETLPKYKHRNEPEYWGKMERRLIAEKTSAKQGAASTAPLASSNHTNALSKEDKDDIRTKVTKKISDDRLKMTTELLFGSHIRDATNSREGSRTITEFFKRKPV